MQAEAEPARNSMTTRYAGRFLTGLVVLFLLFDGGAKVMMVAPVVKASTELQVPERVIPGIGIVLIVATLIYLIPQTSVLGAILLTGYLGGATWTHVRMIGGPVFPIVFTCLFSAIIWGSLYLREPRLRALIPLRLQPRETPAPRPAQNQ
ncbi:DoxX-like family protein [Singulisphaera sp. GP187]|uniref:DoxX family protein n=1 Tax=Singulisphaera sp. GP187 TaxID=1882752 RepID=UPI00092C6334|nr:DoxX family protein [Singulisphaera sp. GP187]SIN82985.1 DoxX-like family protein [Singulisphaera sp. GP187]